MYRDIKRARKDCENRLSENLRRQRVTDMESKRRIGEWAVVSQKGRSTIKTETKKEHKAV